MAIVSVIKYEGDNSTFIWKHPVEDFNKFSQLIVHENQEAVFFLNGQALDLFGPGRYTLDAENIPIIGTLLKLGTGGDCTFHCEVYFINKTVQMALKWGTDSKVRYIDPDFGIPMELGASGSMNLAVCDSRKLLVKLVGTMNGIAWDSEREGFTKSLCASFRPMISTAVKSNLTTAIKAEQFDILEIDEHLESLSAVLRNKILPDFEEYGLTIPQFYLTTVVLPEDDPNFRRIKELHTISMQTRVAKAQATVRTAQIQADATVATAKAQADAEVTAAQRVAVLEKQTTETEVAKAQAERDIIKAQTEAQAARMAGLTEAEIMAAKGYNQKDVLQAEVQKAYAEGIGNMGSSGGGTAGGGIASDMMSMMAGMKMAGAMMGQMDNIMPGFNGTPNPVQTQFQSAQESQVKQTCAKCGAEIPENSKFCLQCGEKVISAVPEGMVICPSCGKTVAKGKFCLECGHKFIAVCPGCGKELPEGAKFCLECGTKIN